MGAVIDGCHSAFGFEPNKMLRRAVLLAYDAKKCLLNGAFQVSFILLSMKVELGNTVFLICIQLKLQIYHLQSVE